MKIVSVGSSSSGNSYIINAAGRVIILDAGLSCIKITRALEELGAEPADVSSILITHEHSDHIKSIRALAKKCSNALVYVSRGTAEGCGSFEGVDPERIRYISAGEEVPEGELLIRAFPLSHDANEPVGYSLITGDEQLSVVTDTGVITDEIYDEIAGSTMLVLEANHDEHLLMYGDYPYNLKMRIKSDLGHLSNRAAGELISAILSERMRCSGEADFCGPFPVMLAHLSFHNNLPFRARSTVEEILEESGFEREKHYTLTIASGDETTILEGNHA